MRRGRADPPHPLAPAARVCASPSGGEASVRVVRRDLAAGVAEVALALGPAFLGLADEALQPPLGDRLAQVAIRAWKKARLCQDSSTLPEDLARPGPGGAGRPSNSRGWPGSIDVGVERGRSSAKRAFFRLIGRPGSRPGRGGRSGSGSTQSNMSTPRRDRLDEVVGLADAHQVARPLGGQQRRRSRRASRTSSAAASPTARPPMA